MGHAISAAERLCGLLAASLLGSRVDRVFVFHAELRRCRGILHARSVKHEAQRAGCLADTLKVSVKDLLEGSGLLDLEKHCVVACVK